MKHQTIINILFIGFLLSCSEKKRDLNRYDQVAEKSFENYQRNRKLRNLKGNVKLVKGTYYKQLVPEVMMNFADGPASEYWFDKKGNELGGRGGMDYKYDAFNNFKEVTSKFYSGTDSIIPGGGRQIDFYSKEGFWMKRTDMEGKDTIYESIHDFQEMSSNYIKYTKKYFSKSKLIEVGKGFHEETYENGKLTSHIWRLTPDTFISKSIYKYDYKGNLLEYIEYTNDNMGKIAYKSTNTYNAWYRKIKEVTISGAGSKKEIYFDKEGNEIKNMQYDDNSIIERERSYTKVYKYDSNGNWIKCETFLLDGTLATVSERKIEYY